MGAQLIGLGLVALCLLIAGAEIWRRLGPARQRAGLRREAADLGAWLSRHDPDLAKVGGRVRQLRAAVASRLGEPVAADTADLAAAARALRQRQQEAEGLLPEQDQIAVRLVAAWLASRGLPAGDLLRLDLDGLIRKAG